MRKIFRARVLIVLFLIGLIVPGSTVAEDDYYIKKSGWSLTKEGGTLTIQTTKGFNEFQRNHASGLGNLENLIIGPGVEKLEFDYVNLRVQPERIIVDAKNKNLFVEGGVLYDRKNRSAILVETTVEKIVFREDTVSIGPSAAENRTGLKEVIFPENLESIGKWAFGFCGLKALILPPNLKMVDWDAFTCNNELESVIFQQDALELGGAVFDGCTKLKTVVLPQKLEKILADTFRSCKSLEHIELPESLVFIGNSAFDNCENLKEIAFPSSLREIDNAAFSDSRFQFVRFPDNIILSNDNRFPAYPWGYGFNDIHTAVFEGENTEIGEDAFWYVRNMIFLNKPPKKFDKRTSMLNPIVYFLDEYAEYWAPNGETTWNGFALRQITRAEAEAMITEAAQPTPTPKPTPTSKATLGPWPTLSPTSTPKSAAAPEPEVGDWVAHLLIGGIVVVAAGVVVLAIMARKKR